MPKPRAIYLLRPDALPNIYGPAQQAALAELVEFVAPPQDSQSVQENPAVLADVDVIFSGWGMPEMNEEFLAQAPNLKALFYGAGSVKKIVTDASWSRGVRVTSAYGANAVTVSQYTLAQVIFSLKRGWLFSRVIRESGGWMQRTPVPGTYGSTVGLVSLGQVGRRVAELLKILDVRVIAYDPFASSADAAKLGVELASLDEVFRRSDVVSLHAPWLPETVGMVTGAHFASMKENATFINTARGAIVRESEMIAVLQDRPDLWAVLDVTYPEPPAPDSPLYTLPNVVLTPHIAGTLDVERERMGQTMVEELRRFLAGEVMEYEITQERARFLA
ncbi:MAG: hydroxyacid dehydrogenase [Caldilineaceae bacterium]|nr:hydroxyacid dehydrogenase [Caldilineaceae bacterium]HRJ41562.1 hydroxyacid dehydrogenase [Caldilineaceae bacterium]